MDINAFIIVTAHYISLISLFSLIAEYENLYCFIHQRAELELVPIWLHIIQCC